MSRIFPCLLESFMSRICSVLFVQNLSRIFSCLEYVQFYLSRICPEFFHVQNMSGKNFWNFSCPEFVQFIWALCNRKGETAKKIFFKLMLFLDIFQYKNHIWYINKNLNFIFLAVSFLSTVKGPYNDRAKQRMISKRNS